MTQDIVRIEGTASDTLTQGSREQCALLSLGKKVTSVNSNRRPPWALKKSQELAALLYLCLCHQDAFLCESRAYTHDQ